MRIEAHNYMHICILLTPITVITRFMGQACVGQHTHCCQSGPAHGRVPITPCVYIPRYLHASICLRMHVCMHAWAHVIMHACMTVCTNTCKHTSMNALLHVCIPSNNHTYMHAFIDAHIRAYLHATYLYARTHIFGIVLEHRCMCPCMCANCVEWAVEKDSGRVVCSVGL